MSIYVLSEYGGCGAEPVAYSSMAEAQKAQNKAWLDGRLVVITPVQLQLTPSVD